MSQLRQDFERDGYVVVKRFLNEEKSQQLSNETERFIKEVVPLIPKEEVYYENKVDKTSLKQVQKVSAYDDYFMELANSEEIVGLAEELLDGPVVLKNMQYFNKIPKTGKGTPAHQDGYYFMIKPQKALTMWLSLGHADANNGAVCYIPGSHKKGIRLHSNTKVLGFSQGISDWSEQDEQDEVQMEAEAGDILVHHSLTIHRANANLSHHNRQSIGFIFYRHDVLEDVDAHQLYKEELNSSLEKSGKI